MAESVTSETKHSRSVSRPGRRKSVTLDIDHVRVMSVLRISSAVAVIWFLIWMIAVAVLYGVMQAAGIFASIAELIGGLEQLTFGAVLAGSALLGIAWAIIGVLLSVIGAVVYNACAGLVGGIEVEASRE